MGAGLPLRFFTQALGTSLLLYSHRSTGFSPDCAFMLQNILYEWEAVLWCVYLHRAEGQSCPPPKKKHLQGVLDQRAIADSQAPLAAEVTFDTCACVSELSFHLSRDLTKPEVDPQ